MRISNEFLTCYSCLTAVFIRRQFLKGRCTPKDLKRGKQQTFFYGFWS